MRSEHFAKGARARVLGLLVVSAFLLPSCEGATDPETQADKAAAMRAAAAWVESHPSEWVLNLTGSMKMSPPEWNQPCEDDPPSGFTALRHTAAQTEIDLFFRCPLGVERTADALRSSFSHAVLQSLPHGISSPGWRFFVRTPSSSVTEEVMFEAPAPGMLRIDISTPLYAVSGFSMRPECEPPADAAMAEECYLILRHGIPLHLSLVLPFEGTELR
jgi:hypothetical protein